MGGTAGEQPDQRAISPEREAFLGRFAFEEEILAVEEAPEVLSEEVVDVETPGDNTLPITTDEPTLLEAAVSRRSLLGLKSNFIKTDPIPGAPPKAEATVSSKEGFWHSRLAKAGAVLVAAAVVITFVVRTDSGTSPESAGTSSTVPTTQSATLTTVLKVPEMAPITAAPQTTMDTLPATTDPSETEPAPTTQAPTTVAATEAPTTTLPEATTTTAIIVELPSIADEETATTVTAPVADLIVTPPKPTDKEIQMHIYDSVNCDDASTEIVANGYFSSLATHCRYKTATLQSLNPQLTDIEHLLPGTKVYLHRQTAGSTTGDSKSSNTTEVTLDNCGAHGGAIDAIPIGFTVRQYLIDIGLTPDQADTYKDDVAYFFGLKTLIAGKAYCVPTRAGMTTLWGI